MNNDTHTQCTKCGRSFPKSQGCCNCCRQGTGEYCKKVGGQIRHETDLSCEKMATIPWTTIDTIDGLTRISDGFVHVTGNNTVYYIDDKHRIGSTWAGPVEDPDYDIDKNPKGLRSQFLSTTTTDEEGEVKNVLIYYDKDGSYYVVNQEGEGMVIYNELKELIDDEAADRETADNELANQIAAKQDPMYAGNGISIDSNTINNTGVVSLVAGSNVQIDEYDGGIRQISATDTKYSAGYGITISPENVISLTNVLEEGWGIADVGYGNVATTIAPGATVTYNLTLTSFDFSSVSDYALILQPHDSGSDAWQGMDLAWNSAQSSSGNAVIEITNLGQTTIALDTHFQYALVAKGYGGGSGSVTLYSTTGQNTDGAMTQKATTDELNAVNQNLLNIQNNLQNQINLKANQVDLDAKQNRLTAGQNIAIVGNVITAVDTKYTAGTGIAISPGNVISVTSQATGLKLQTGTVDIGEGVLLAEDTIYGVYE